MTVYIVQEVDANGIHILESVGFARIVSALDNGISVAVPPRQSEGGQVEYLALATVSQWCRAYKRRYGKTPAAVLPSSELPADTGRLQSEGEFWRDGALDEVKRD